MPSKALVLDANILVRAVLGNRVRQLIEAYSSEATFFVPRYAYAEAEEHFQDLSSNMVAIQKRHSHFCVPWEVW